MALDDWLDPSGALLGRMAPLPTDAPFTFEQASDSGVSRGQLRRLVERGLVRRIVRGVYVASQVLDSLHLRVGALALVVPPGGVVTDRSAAWLHGVDILPRSRQPEVPPVEVFLTPGNRMRRGLVVSGERTLSRRDVMEVGGVQVTTPLRTALDLGRLLWRYDALAALDGFLRLGVSHGQLLLEVERFKGHRGVVQLRALAPLADRRAESPPESALRLHWLDAGLPTPEPQLVIRGDSGVERYRLDLGNRELRYGAEYFGEDFHRDEEADAARLEWIARHRGFVIDVFSSHHVYGPGLTAYDVLVRGMVRARRNRGLWLPPRAG